MRTSRRFIQQLFAEPGLLALDLLGIAVAYAVALLLRFDGQVPPSGWRGYALFLPVALLLHAWANARRRLYGQVWSQAGAHDARVVVSAVLDAGAVLFVIGLLHPGSEQLPRSVPLLGAVLTLLVFGATRFRRRLFGRARPGAAAAEPTRVVLVGAIEPARTLIQAMQNEPERGLVPVAVLTPQPRHWGRWIAGVPVEGPLAMLPTAARTHDAEQALLAFERFDGAEVRRAVDRAREAGLTVRVFPTVHEVLGAAPSLRDIRDISIDDLLGRPQVEIDMAAIGRLLRGRRVLITGAGGSIGSEITAQVASFEPGRLVLLDHDETHLHDVVVGLDRTAVPVLGDIRDDAFVQELFATERPEVVFHAAAHKHVPILEAFPSEAVHTNVLGTDNLLRAAATYDVQRFVTISTDKAVNPSSVMGASKRLSEQLMLHRRPPGAAYCAVRFGNVLGSRGSVVPTFVRQIEDGGPVTVTHPDMTRFFMSAREAVQLVLQAAVLAGGGEIYVLDMGEPVRIVDLARRLILLAGATPGREIDIEYVGVRPGEKLAEELVAGGEDQRPTAHPQIDEVHTPLLAPRDLAAGLDRLRRLADAHEQTACAEALHALVAGAPARSAQELRA
ncbi:polysaccharide biosynthesis protein [Egicoccus sp. AB-alg2]|uniref:polysaccharide biosynthesis protein n=1 Tax=Egicoccus sp. AB-alg2 TaxID=3242693 RepID=UPI00359EAF31